jgi:hypothetical protein
MCRLAILFLLVITITSCNNKEVDVNSKIELIDNKEQVFVKVENYFDFDNVDYYFKDINENDVFKVYDDPKSKDKESKEYKYLQIMEGNYPNLLNNEFSTNLINNGYHKRRIDSNRFDDLNSIFSETKCDDGYAMACIPVYRDILIFYNEGKIIGIAKICFGCRQYHIIGTDKNLEDFGQCGGYEKLQDLLSK